MDFYSFQKLHGGSIDQADVHRAYSMSQCNCSIPTIKGGLKGGGCGCKLQANKQRFSGGCACSLQKTKLDGGHGGYGLGSALAFGAIGAIGANALFNRGRRTRCYDVKPDGYRREISCDQ